LTKTLRYILSFLLGCTHRHETRPLRRRMRNGKLNYYKPSYVVCVDCGRERDCDTWDPKKSEETYVGHSHSHDTTRVTAL